MQGHQETPGVPQTGDDHWKPIFLFALLGVSAAGLMVTMLYKKRHKKQMKQKKKNKLWMLQTVLCAVCIPQCGTNLS